MPFDFIETVPFKSVILFGKTREIFDDRTVNRLMGQAYRMEFLQLIKLSDLGFMQGKRPVLKLQDAGGSPEIPLLYGID